MGLDIYLYEKAHHEQNARRKTEWESLWERKDKGEITEEQYDALRANLTPHASHTDAPSTINPEHLFNRRYLRSSYNEGGFNSVAENVGGHDLYWIFEPLNVEFDGWDGLVTTGHVVALQQCRERAIQVAEEIRTWDRLKVTEIRGPMLGAADHLWSKLPTKDQVMTWVRGELAREHVIDGSYSCAKGSVFPEGFEVLAITQGAPRFAFFSDGDSVTYAVFRVEDAALESYVQSALITAEFCDEAIALIERDESAYMSWSG
jgi:hypothetical protein